MNVGLLLPRPLGTSAQAAAEHFMWLAKKADDLGYYSLWLGDHLVFPVERTSPYPMTPTGRLAIVDTNENLFEILTLLAALAPVTARVKLGTNVLVLPYRHPLLTAKILATLDVVSHGRVILGIGVGWLKEEFTAFGAATFEHRGALTDEYLRIFKELWTRQSPSFTGRWYSFSGFGFAPQPIQKPHIPIWIGGASAAALRRTARAGDGWHPSHLSPDDYKAGVEALTRLCREVNRDPKEVTLSVSLRVRFDMKRSTSGGAERVVPDDVPAYYVGSPEQIAATLRQYERVGTTHVVCEPLLAGMPPTTANAGEAIDVMASRVLPLLA